MKSLYILFVLGLFLCLNATSAYALKISPFKATLIPDGSAKSQVFRVENNSLESVAVQVSVLSWSIQPDGTEINEDAEDEFTVFPAQIVLKPNESRGVRIQWQGKNGPTVEKPYRVLAEQVPINLKSTPLAASAVKFMLRFKAAFYLAPEKTESDVKVKSFEMLPDNILKLTFSNNGTGHTLLKDPVLTLDMTDGRSIEVPKDNLGVLAGENIHAGNERFFKIPVPSDIGSDIKDVHFDYHAAF